MIYLSLHHLITPVKRFMANSAFAAHQHLCVTSKFGRGHDTTTDWWWWQQETAGRSFADCIQIDTRWRCHGSIQRARRYRIRDGPGLIMSGNKSRTLLSSFCWVRSDAKSRFKCSMGFCVWNKAFLFLFQCTPKNFVCKLNLWVIF